MSYQVLARKWRPQKFQDVIGQEHITRSLANSVINDRFGHAYLLSGTRGIGKTTVARIFARAIRCQNLQADGNPCGLCLSCEEDASSSLNTIEIDGASNNTVDEIRDLISNVSYLPTIGKYKVYIVDEVHMLSKSAFNALLKTLEEPPEHVVFIFATTEPEKLLGTVLSRCQRFDFRNASIDDLENHLKNIGAKEEIVFKNNEIIRQICKEGNGSVRDTLSLLDQVLSYSTDKIVDEEVISNALGITKRSTIEACLQNLFSGNQAEVSSIYRQIISENIPLKNFVSSLLDVLFETIEKIDSANTDLVPEDVSATELFWIYEELASSFSWVEESIDPVTSFEVILRKTTQRRELLGQMEVPASSKKKVATPKEENQEEAVKEEPVHEGTPNWDAFLDHLRDISQPTMANLERGNVLAQPEIVAGKLNIDLAFPTEAHLFFDYVKEVQDKVRGYLADFYKIEKDNVKLEINLIQSEEVKERNFRSKNKIIQEEHEKTLEEKRTRIKDDPMIQKAEELFNTKIDKILVNEEK